MLQTNLHREGYKPGISRCILPILAPTLDGRIPIKVASPHSDPVNILLILVNILLIMVNIGLVYG